MIKTLYKKQDGEKLVVVGHFTYKEVGQLMREGYRSKKPVYNKNGIKVEG